MHIIRGNVPGGGGEGRGGVKYPYVSAKTNTFIIASDEPNTG